MYLTAVQHGPGFRMRLVRPGCTIIKESWAHQAAVPIYVTSTLHGPGFRTRVRLGCMVINEFWAHREAVRICIKAVLHGPGFKMRVRPGCMLINESILCSPIDGTYISNSCAAWTRL
jgi:hypothetical protein